MEKVKEKVMHTKILAAIGIACMILGIFFAYVKVSLWGFSQSISLLKYWEGYVILVLALVNILIIFKANVEKFLPKMFKGKFGQFLVKIENQKFSLIPTGLVAVLVIYLHSVVMTSSYIHYGLGFYLILIGIILLAVYPFIYKAETIQGINNEVE